MKSKQKAIVISSDDEEEKKLIQQQPKKRLVRNDFQNINEEIKRSEFQQRKRKVIFDDEDDEKVPTQKNSEENFESKKKFKLIKKQEIIIQAAQQEATACPICYGELNIIQAVILECGHLFCQKCIQTQCEKYQNNCPLCRKIYKNYTLCIRGEDGEYLRGQLIKIKKKAKKQEYLDENDDEEEELDFQESISQPSFVQDSQYDAGDSFIVADDEICEECQRNEDMESMLFCKKCGCVVRHSYCQSSNSSNKVLCYECRTYQQR